MANDPLALYEALLKSFDMSVVDGVVSEPDGNDGQRACVVRGKRLVLPTRNILRSADWTQAMAFHPLCENAEGAPSAILKNMTTRILRLMNSRISMLLIDLLRLASDAERQGTMSPAMVSFMSKLPDINDKAIDAGVKVVGALFAEDASTNRLINVYLKRGGKLGGQSYYRTAVVAFPVREEFDRPDGIVWGMDVGKRAKNAVNIMFKLIMNLDRVAEDAYCTGSNSQTAPFFDALVRTYLKVQGRINEVVDLFGTHLPNGDDMRSDLSWAGLIENLEQYKGVIPVLAGNDRDDPVPARPVEATPVVAPIPGTPAALGTVANTTAVAERKFPPGIRVRDTLTPMAAPGVPAPNRPVGPDDEMREWGELQNRKAFAASGMRGYGAVGRPAVPQQQMQQPAYGYQQQQLPQIPMQRPIYATVGPQVNTVPTNMYGQNALYNTQQQQPMAPMGVHSRPMGRL